MMFIELFIERWLITTFALFQILNTNPYIYTYLDTLLSLGWKGHFPEVLNNELKILSR